MARHGLGVKAGYARLGGHSVTDKLSTPLASPFNGWTDLFVNVPSLGTSHGLEARYLSLSGPLRVLGGATGTLTWYNYHSDSRRIHYGNELDLAFSYKVRRIGERWELGWRFGLYRAGRLFSNAVRTSLFTSFAL